MFILGANSAGLFNKKESLLRIISLFNPGVVFIQESKARRKNKLNLNNYIIFELIRKDNGGGGLLTAVHKSLSPVSVSNEDEQEILVVEANLSNSKVRFINGYGPQENATEEVRKPFYDQLDLEIKKSKMAGCFVCIEMDSNAKLGPSIIPGDPKPQSMNGKLLEKVVNENELIVVNATDVCEGLITRHRQTIHGVEESVIDHFIVCREMFKLIKRMLIDESCKYSLTKYTNKSGSATTMKESDHRTMIIEVSTKLNPLVDEKEERVEIFNYKNSEDFEKFVQITNNNDDLNHCFDDEDEALENSSKRWLKLLKNIIKRSFRKIRMKKSKLKPELENLFQQKETLKSQLAEKVNQEDLDDVIKLNQEIDNVSEKIANICAEKNRDIVNEYIGNSNDVLEGFSQAKTWAMKKKLSPKNTVEPPAAKKDDQGNLITGKEALENLYLKTYEDRLQPNPLDDDLIEQKNLKEYLF